MMDKTFDPAAVEARIAARWEAAGAFRGGRPERQSAEPYSIVIPPPNVTGSLHMGHALNNTLQDILCRFERMRGKDVLWQPGTDHAGIATQMVVERRLAAENKSDRRSMGREAFLAAGEASLATRPTDGEVLESERLKARLGEMLLERELLEAKIAALEVRDPRPLPRRRSKR